MLCCYVFLFKTFSEWGGLGLATRHFFGEFGSGYTYLPDSSDIYIKFVYASGGLAKSSEPIPFEYSCQVTSGGKQSHAFPQKTIKMN